MKIGKELQKINPTIALNVLHIKQKGLCPACISKISSNCQTENNKIRETTSNTMFFSF